MEAAPFYHVMVEAPYTEQAACTKYIYGNMIVKYYKAAAMYMCVHTYITELVSSATKKHACLRDALLQRSPCWLTLQSCSKSERVRRFSRGKRHGNVR